jgi:hypothetical protein
MQATQVRRRVKPSVFCAAFLHVPPIYRCRLHPRGLAGFVELSDTMYSILPLGADRSAGFALTDCASGACCEVSVEAGRLLCDCGSSRPCDHVRGLEQLARDGAL